MNAPFARAWLAAGQWTPLARWFAVLAAVASIAAIRASLLPLWPRAESLPEGRIASALKQAGLAATAVPLQEAEAKPQRNHDKALSPTLAFRFRTGEELRLVRGAVRNPLDFDPNTFSKQRKDLRLSKGKPAGPPPQRIGTIAGRPARQTCLVALSPTARGYEVEWSPLGKLVTRSSAGQANTVRRLLGLEPSRDYSCVLISLRSGGAGPVSPELWNRLLAILPAALTPPAATGTAAPATAPTP